MYDRSARAHHLDVDRGGGARLRPRARARRGCRSASSASALLLPPNWALAAGLVVNLPGVGDLPAAVERPLELLGAATLPLTMLYAGLMIELRGLRRLWGEVGYISVVRLGLGDVIGLAVAVAFQFSGDVLHTVVIMAAHANRDDVARASALDRACAPTSSRAAVVVTTLLATLTLPAWRAALL